MICGAIGEDSNATFKLHCCVLRLKAGEYVVSYF